MKGVPCDESRRDTLYENPLLNRGCRKEKHPVDGLAWCGVFDGKPCDETRHIYMEQVWPNPLKQICERAYALEALQFMVFGLSTMLLLLGFLMLKRKGENFNFKPWKTW